MNLFQGKYTINRNYILRKSFLGYSLYDITKATSIQINLYFYSVLRMFLHNCTNLTEIGNYFTSKGIKGDIKSIQELINTRNDLCDLFIESNVPAEREDMYRKIQSKDSLIYEHTPETIDFLITNKCNLNCPHCYRNSKTSDKMEKIVLSRVFTLLDEMEALRVCSLKITGGEPFLVPELYEIVAYASKKRIRLAILTNATLPFNNKWLDLLKSENISLGISLDGSTAHSHDAIRGKGSFKKTFENIVKFSEQGINFSLTFSVNILNKKEISDVIELVVSKTRAKNITFNFVEEIGRASLNESLFSTFALNTEKIKEDINLLKIKYKDKLEINLTDNHGLAKDAEDLNIIKDKGDLIICKAGFGSIAVDANLMVYPCIYAIGGEKEYPIVSLLDNSLIEVWNNSKLDTFRGRLKVNDLLKCRNCEYKEQCNLKYCRLRPIFEGKKITDSVSFCKKVI